MEDRQFTTYVGPYIRVEKSPQLQGPPDDTLYKGFDDILSLVRDTEDYMIFIVSDVDLNVGYLLDSSDVDIEIPITLDDFYNQSVQFVETHAKCLKLLKALGKSTTIQIGVLTFLS